MKEKNETLFDLTGKWVTVYNMASDPDIDMDVLADTLEGIEGEIEAKADSYAAVIYKLNADAEFLKAQEQRLKAKRDAIENSVKRMKQSLQDTMELMGKPKIKTALWSFGIQSNPASVVLDCDMDALPEEYKKYAAPTVDKAKLSEALKSGEKLEGIAHLVQTQSLRIR